MKNLFIRNILFLILTLTGLASKGQAYSALDFTTSNKSYGVAQAVPTDARSYFYDRTLFAQRPFQSTAEVLSFLTTAKSRTGQFPIIVRSGGTLVGLTFTGGKNSEYWFKDGTADSNLVLKTQTIAGAGDGYTRNKIVTWGNSLTAGQPDAQYPAQLAVLLHKEVYNGGVGGQTSTQIAVRMGALHPNVTIAGGTIPASGGVNITFPAGYEPITLQGPIGGIYGTINGIYGLLSWLDNSTTAGVFTFTRSVSGTSAAVATSKFVIDNGDLLTYPTIIELGRNNLTDSTQVLSDLDSCVAALGHSKYVFLNILNAQTEKNDNYTGIYAKVIALNNSILRKVGAAHYVAWREYIVSKYNPSIAQDVTDHSQDIEPTSLTFDGLHLNNAGYGWTAELLTHSQYQTTLFPVADTAKMLTTSSIGSILNNPIVGKPGVLSFTSVNKGIDKLGLVVKGGAAANDYTGVDLINEFRSSNPLARIGMLATSTGSVLKIGTSNDWRNGITTTNFTAYSNGNVGIGNDHLPLQTLDVYGSALIRGKLTFNGAPTAYITCLPILPSATNAGQVYLGGNPEHLLGSTANSFQYPFEIQQGNAAANANRFQILSHRNVAGSNYQGTEFWLNYGVDNSGTDGSIAHIGIGAGDTEASGGGLLSFSTSNADRLKITSDGRIIAQGTGAFLQMKPTSAAATYLSIQNNLGANRLTAGWNPTGDYAFMGNAGGEVMTVAATPANPAIGFPSGGLHSFTGSVSTAGNLTATGTLNATGISKLAGYVSVGNTHTALQPLDVYGNALVRGKLTFNGAPTAYITCLPLLSTATDAAQIFLAGNAPASLGATAGSYQHIFELQQGNSASNVDRFQISAYRRIAGSAYQGTGFRLQYGVDNSGTTGGIANIEINASDADASGGGNVVLSTGGTDRLTVKYDGTVNISGNATSLKATASNHLVRKDQLDSLGGTRKVLADADYTITSSDNTLILFDPASTNRTLTLPAASTMPNKEIKIVCRTSTTGKWVLSGTFVSKGTTGTIASPPAENSTNPGLVTAQTYLLISVGSKWYDVSN